MERESRVQVASGAIFADDSGRFLIVNSTYDRWWNIPGGAANDGEPPWKAVVREVEEELSLSVDRGQLLAVDFRYSTETRPSRLRFVFDCGVLSEEQISIIVLPERELSEYRFLTLVEASPLLLPAVARRLHHALPLLGTGRVAYLEEGEPVSVPKGRGHF